MTIYFGLIPFDGVLDYLAVAYLIYFLVNGLWYAPVGFWP